MKSRFINSSNWFGILVAVAGGAIAGLVLIFNDPDGRAGTSGATSEYGVLTAGLAEAGHDWAGPLANLANDGDRDLPLLAGDRSGGAWSLAAHASARPSRAIFSPPGRVRDGPTRGPPPAA